MATSGESREPENTSRLRESAPSLQISLARNAEAPSLARAAVAGFLEETRMSRANRATVTLLVSELVSNAVVHSDAPPESHILLRAHLLQEDGVHVEVIDQGSGFTPIARDPTRPHGGYGLYLVDKQVANWGVDRQDGTRVWFDQLP
ncbi:MAG TPA: ATP-binding protein [Solirubrobacteraceae bacterium]